MTSRYISDSRNLISLFLCIAFVHFVRSSKEVCYGKYGCFNGDPPFNRFGVRLPEPPELVGTTFRLFTRANRLRSQILDDSDVGKLTASNFDDTKRTIVVVHGYLEHHALPWVNRMRYALVDREDANVITVGWGKGADGLPAWSYGQAVGNTRLVGAQLAELLKFLIANTNTTADNVYIVGMSLGAHIAGYAGRRLRNISQPIGRISGLDPAGSYFENLHKDVRLDPTDAKFVDAMHTDADFAGLWQQVGHLDFYINGGAIQPKGCKDFIGGLPAQIAACDHMRCPEYYTETVVGKCSMYGYYCKSQADLQNGRCISANSHESQDVPAMGYDAKKYKNNTKLFYKKYYSITNRKPLFCAFVYMITLKTGISWFAGIRSQVIVKLTGTKGDTGDMYLQKRDLNAGSVESFVALSRNDVGDLLKFDVRYNGIPFLSRWYLVSAVVKAGWKDQIYTACFNSKLQTSGGIRTLRKGNDKC